MLKKVLFLVFQLLSLAGGEELKSDSKLLICGTCRNVGARCAQTIENVEVLGSRFADYHVIFYENNSTDNTSALFSKWAQQNGHVTFLTECLPPEELPLTRTERIARGRNIVLSIAKDSKFSDFEYLVMADLDSEHPWPVDEVIKTIQSDQEWDCVSANDFCLDDNPYLRGGYYRDRSAFRDENYPLGPEMMGDDWYVDLSETWFRIEQDEWLPVYSAFGGFAIYKTKSILPFSYSGLVTEELKRYYDCLLSKTRKSNRQRMVYVNVLKKEEERIRSSKSLPVVFHRNTPWERPIDYPYVTVCEHVTLHASMALNGHGIFFINPKMIVRFKMGE